MFAVVRQDYRPKSLTDENIEELQKRLKALKEHEQEAASMAGLRNELEAYIYGSLEPWNLQFPPQPRVEKLMEAAFMLMEAPGKDKMEREDIIKVSTEEQREEINKLCTEYEEWVHEAVRC
eukprot:g9040.t1